MNDLDLAKKYIQKSKNAKSRNIEFSISLVIFRNMMKSKKCYFTGLDLNDKTRTIDRVDNKLGYVTGNVRSCHEDFNRLKGTIEDPSSKLTFELCIKGLKKATIDIGKNKVKEVIDVECYTTLIQPTIKKPLVNQTDLTGMRSGSLIIIGVASNLKSKWVAKCDCGRFCFKNASLINKGNDQGLCYECDQIEHAKWLDQETQIEKFNKRFKQ